MLGHGDEDFEGITLTWRNLSVYADISERRFFSGGRHVFKRIINNVTGTVKAGNLVALMGPSGSGKSTLMSALANRNPNKIYAEGDVYVNGIPVGGFLNKISGFLYQEDLFVGALTVREHLRFMCWMKLGRNKRSSDIEKLVNDLLTKVDLVSSADRRIGASYHESTLSGGEKKKLAFATEMITKPKLFFCDEPTTGLDSFSAQSIVQLMRTMASENKTVLCTIHQPSSEIFDMFSNLILLFEGRIAFIGSSKEALEYFESHGFPCPSNYNPAEFFVRILTSKMSDKDAKRFCDGFSVSKYATELDSFADDTVVRDSEMIRRSTNRLASVDNWNKPRWPTKMYWLTHRSFLQVIRDPSVQAVRIIQKLGIAFMAGLCFTNNEALTQSGVQSVQGAIFLFVTENTFPGMYAVLSMFPQELPLFLREYRNGFYSSRVFYVSKMASLLPGLILDPFLFVLVFYFLAGLRSTLYAFCFTVLMAVLTANVATACVWYKSTEKKQVLLKGFSEGLCVVQCVLNKYNLCPVRKWHRSYLPGTFWVFALAHDYNQCILIITGNEKENWQDLLRSMTGIGCFFSNAFESVSIAMACLVPFDYMLMVTSGLFIKLETLPYLISWFRYLSWFMYSNEVLLIVQWEGIKNISCEYTNPDIPCITDGDEVLAKFNFSPSHMYRNILAMIIMYVVFHIFACFFLWRKAKVNK